MKQPPRGGAILRDTDETERLEQLAARVTVSADAGFLPPLVDFVRQTAHRLGLRGEAA